MAPLGMAAAWGLSATPELQTKYATSPSTSPAGGSAASARHRPRAAHPARILQNGAHFIFGAYNNTLKLFREAYARTSRRAACASFGTFAEAFVPREARRLQAVLGRPLERLDDPDAHQRMQQPGTGGAVLVVHQRPLRR